MQIFANGKRRFHSFIEFFVIHLKNLEVKISSQWHFKQDQGFRRGTHLSEFTEVVYNPFQVAE